MSGPLGIEKIGVYPGALALDVEDLCAARGLDPATTRTEHLVDQKTVLAPWEDTVTLAVNAAASMLTAADRAAIGLLIVATETSVDQEKPVSSWVHGLLGLRPDCRNFEVKHACYAATAALHLAQAWLASGFARDRKVLIVSADAALIALGEPHEPVVGAGACAILVSTSPRLVEYEPGHAGVYAQEVSDVIRPTPRIEIGAGETSLFAYIEATTATFASYLASNPEAADFDAYFAKNIYHVPFGGITFRAHRTLLEQFSKIPRAGARAHFERKVLPSLTFNRRMGGTYGASTFIALAGLCATATDLRPGDRIGIFSYGSGSCAEFYAARASATFREAALEANIAARLDARRRLSVDEYERCERTRDAAVGAQDFTPDRGALGATFETHFAGRRLLVLDRIESYYRHYVWS